MGIVLGAGILGADASRRESANFSDGSGAGAIVLGVGILGEKAVPAEPVVETFTVTQVKGLLAKDAANWQRVLAAETERPDGPRKQVALALVGISDQVELPALVLSELKKLAGLPTE